MGMLSAWRAASSSSNALAGGNNTMARRKKPYALLPLIGNALASASAVIKRQLSPAPPQPTARESLR